MHGEQVHQPLHQPQEEHAVVHHRGTRSRLEFACGVVQEHEVEIGAVAELDAAELAVGDDDHPGLRKNAVGRSVARRAVPGHDLVPGQVESLSCDQLRNVRETIAHLHHGQPARQIGHRYAKHGGPLELPQQVDLPFGIRRVGTGHPCAQVVLQLAARRRGLEQPLVEQFVEQQRKRRDLVGEKLRLGTQLDQALARDLVLVEQREINGAPPIRSTTCSRREQHDRLMVVAAIALQQPPVSRRAAVGVPSVEASQVAAVAHQVEALEDRCRVAQSRRAQRRDPPLIRARLEDRSSARTTSADASGSSGRTADDEVPAHCARVPRDLLFESGPSGRSQENASRARPASSCGSSCVCSSLRS